MAKKKSAGLFQFLFSKMFFKNVLYAGIFVIVVVAVLWFSLNIYTDHGNFVTVPHVEGLSIEQAEERFADVGLDYFVRDSI